MNRIDKLFKEKKSSILSIYFTAGYPHLDSTTKVIRSLASAGADMIEIGMPFSDPMADGPVIQRSNEKALLNGMTLRLLFDQLKDIRNEISVPLILMGYLNPVMQFGIESFCRKCRETGIDGVILPDLPVQVYTEEYRSIFNENDLYNILLITPQSSRDRILEIDKASRGFVYMVSSSSVTGTKGNFSEDQMSYFKRVSEMNLKNPGLIGFGISNNDTFIKAGKYARGGIIGSAFVKTLGQDGNIDRNITHFIKGIRGCE
jgi:tryptophan synthase alpha chain